MSLYRRIKTIEPEKPVVAKPATTERASAKPTPSEKPIRKGAGGRKPSPDPTVVVTLRLKRSVAERLPPDWRSRAAEFLARV